MTTDRIGTGLWRWRAALSLSMGATWFLACADGVTMPDGDQLPPTPTAEFTPAFPGAEGFGARAIGGRGGTAIAVTNLNDSGSGSLRAAVETTGPRTIVFHVGGTITLESTLRIGDPFITIAGQTAPGGGIALRSDGGFARPLLEIGTNDVVLRHVRLRPGPDASVSGSCCVDALSIIGVDAFNVIVDHVSMSWAVDEVSQIFDGAHDVTVQWSILAEGLYCSNHNKTVSSRGGGGVCPDGANPHSRGMTISTFPNTGTSPDRVSLHHNLWANSETRFPNVTSSTLIDVVNNIMYNFTTAGSRLGLKNAGAPLRANFVNNFYKPGPSTIAVGAPWALTLDQPTFQTDAFEIYWEGNEVGAPIQTGWADWEGTAARHRVSAPHEVESVTPTASSAAFDAVLSGAGATLPVRDAVDARIVNEVSNGTGGFVDHPTDVGGWPALPTGTPPTDSDLDGMPDGWENGNALDRLDPSDGAADSDADGYTNLEEYLNNTDPRIAN